RGWAAIPYWAVKLVEQLRKSGLQADVHVLLNQPTLAALAVCNTAASNTEAFQVPGNRVPPGCTRITADMLSLVTLEQAAIDRIVASVRAVPPTSR
ncbi:hypothetical protein CU663_05505, partial [Pseudomonas syringae pv. actinidifoliorum]|nr:hypothetical protein [Pseudomonas syringae pv. actinidifoliorum]